MQVTLDTAIERLDISVRTYNSLKQAGVFTCRDALAMSFSELVRTPNFGIKSLNELIEVFSRHGWGWGKESPWPDAKWYKLRPLERRFAERDAAIMAAVDAGGSQKDQAAKYGISKQSISAIVKRERRRREQLA